MNTDKAQILAEKINHNITTLMESTGSADMAAYAPIIVPLLHKLYTEALISQIADVQELKSPVGKVPCLFSVYSGLGSSAETSTHPDTSFLIVVPDTTTSTTWIIDDVITIGTSTFSVRYFEKDKDTTGEITRVLLSRTTGSYIPSIGDTISLDSREIVYSSWNRAAIRKLFKGYAGTVITDGNGNYQYVGYNYGYDNNNDIKFIGFEVRTIDVTTVARKLKSKFSQEQLYDMVQLYKEKGLDTFSDALSHELRQEIDKEFICYIKYIAEYLDALNTVLHLSDSYGASPSGSLQDISYDLVANIYIAAEKIVRDTKRNRTIFVLADPVTCGFLQTNAFHVKANIEEKNPYRIGSIGVYPLFCDLYADPAEHYILVGYLGIDGNGDAGIIYSPYTTTIHQVTDGDFKENVLYMNRYAITRHPQDIGNKDHNNIWSSDNANNSDFFKMFSVDYTGVINLGNTSGKFDSVSNFK